jgi:hypothetical protein
LTPNDLGSAFAAIRSRSLRERKLTPRAALCDVEPARGIGIGRRDACASTHNGYLHDDDDDSDALDATLRRAGFA